MTREQPTVVEYEAPDRDATRRMCWDAIGLGLAMATVLGIVVGTAGIVATFFIPRLEQLFKDYGSEFPWLTKLFLAAGRFYVHGANGLVFWTIPIVVPIIVTWLNFRRAARGQARIRMVLIIAITMMIGALLVFLIAVAAIAPVVMLIRKVAKL